MITSQRGYYFIAIKYKSNLHLLHINDPRYKISYQMGGERLNTKILKVLKFSHVAIDSELPWGFPCGSADKESACNVGDWG